MPKKLRYFILDNHVYDQLYQGNENKVMKDSSIPWNESSLIGGYWGEFIPDSSYHYDELLDKMIGLSEELKNNPCDYYREQHYFHAWILNQLRIGQTLFLKYE